jgi:exodeoxyribonuclease-5
MLTKINGQFGAMPKHTSIIGAAGTGKTEQIKTLIQALDQSHTDYYVVAYTNRAAKVLRDRGITATTVHKTLYECRKKEPEEIVEVMVPILDSATRLPQRDEKGQILYGVHEEAKWEFAFKKDAFKASDVLIIDEASLLPSTMWGEIFDNWPGDIVIAGDQNQLPPVEIGEEDQRDERFVGFFHRAAKTPTIYTGGNLDNKRIKDGSAVLPAIYDYICSPKNPTGRFPDLNVPGEYDYIDLTKDTNIDSAVIDILEAADIVIAWKNDECNFINEVIRRRRARNLGRAYTPYPLPGDRIVAGKHYIHTTTIQKRYWDKEQGCEVEYEKEEKEQLVTRGEEYVIESVDHPDARNNVVWVTLKDVRLSIPLSIAQIDGGRARKELNAITWNYAYAITCHKAQGTGWGTVVVVDSYSMPKDAQRWRYTAATRAEKHVIVIRSGISFDKRKLLEAIFDEPRVPAPPSENRLRLRKMLEEKFDK